MSATDNHTPDRTGGEIEVNLVDNRVQFSSRNPASGRLDFCFHFERADALQFSELLRACAEGITLVPDEEQKRIARAYRLGQQNTLDALREYRIEVERRSSNPRMGLLVNLLEEIERQLEKRLDLASKGGKPTTTA